MKTTMQAGAIKVRLGRHADWQAFEQKLLQLCPITLMAMKKDMRVWGVSQGKALTAGKAASHLLSVDSGAVAGRPEQCQGAAEQPKTTILGVREWGACEDRRRHAAQAVTACTTPQTTLAPFREDGFQGFTRVNTCKHTCKHHFRMKPRHCLAQGSWVFIWRFLHQENN